MSPIAEALGCLNFLNNAIPLARVGALPRRREGSADVAELGIRERQQGAAPAAPWRTSEGTASAQRINRVAAVPCCEHFPVCTYPEGQCAELCLPGGLKP